MLSAGQDLLEWIAAHPQPALWLLFLTALLDALFIVGALVPASIVLFAMGALVALGVFDLWPTAIIAAAGALTGDAVSFWLGRRYGERLFSARLLQKYPELIANGRAFFQKHGGKGVFLARFLGPVRAVTPAVAGASSMPVWWFLLADGLASYIWALLYIVPGVVFGASMGLAAEVAGRLALLLLLVLALLGLAFWLSGVTIFYMQRRASDWLNRLMDLSQAHRRLGKFGAALADPQQPETPVLALIAACLIAFSGLWLVLWAHFGGAAYPSRFDALVYQTLHDLQTPWSNWLAFSISQLGHPAVYLPVAAAVLLTLVIRRKGRAAAHWVAALAFGAVISLGVHAFPTLPSPTEFYHGLAPAEFAPRDLVMVTVVYGFIPVLLSTQRRPGARRRQYAVATGLLLLIAAARLYLGVEWFSQIAFALILSLVWLSALGLGYRRHAAERIHPRGFLIPVLSMFLIAAGLRCITDGGVPERIMPAGRQDLISSDIWQSGGYADLPSRRIDLRGEPGPAFEMQWAAPLDEIRAALIEQGWTPPAPLGGGNVLRWLTASTPLGELPVLPQVHAGSHPALTVRRTEDDETQWMLRLWPSGWSLEDGRPLWLGDMVSQRARTLYRLLRYPVAESNPVGEWSVPPPFSARAVPGPAGSLLLIARSGTLTTPVPRWTGPVVSPAPTPAVGPSPAAAEPDAGSAAPPDPPPNAPIQTTPCPTC